MAFPSEVELLDGTMFAIDRGKWQTVAHPVKASTVNETSESLVVEKHPDGRMLVYAVIESPGTGQWRRVSC